MREQMRRGSFLSFFSFSLFPFIIIINNIVNNNNNNNIFNAKDEECLEKEERKNRDVREKRDEHLHPPLFFF